MKKFFFFAAMTSVLFGACSTEVDPINETSGVLRLASVSTVGMEARAEAVDYTENIKINLEAQGNYVAVDGREVTANPWTITGAAIPVGVTARNLTAWGPATITPDGGAGNVFTLTSVKYDVASDLVFSKNVEVSVAASAANLVLEHAYAQVTLKFETDGNYLEDKAITKVDLKNAPKTSTIDITTGTVEAAASTEPSIALWAAGATFTDSYSALVIPQATGAAMKVDCVIDGKAYSDVALNIATLEKGTNYEVTLKLKGTVMNVASVKVQPWNSVRSSEDLN